MLLSNFNFLNSPQTKRKRNYSDKEGSPRKRKHSEEVEGGVPEHDKLSPLDLNIVLAKICSFLPLQDLGNCRLINHLWNEEATPYFSSHSQMEIDNLSLDSGRTPRDFWSKLGNLSSSHLNITRGDIRDPDLYNIFQKFGSKVRTLEVDAVAETEDIETTANLMRRNYFLFVANLCPNLVELKLKNLADYVIDTGFPPLLRALMVNACLSLKKLSFRCESYYCGLDAQFLIDLLDFAPNLEELSFSVGDDDALDEIFLALEHRPILMKKVRSLSFGRSSGNTIYTTHIQTLLNLNLESLERLEMQQVHSELMFQIGPFFHLLESVSKTLKVLRLGSKWNNDLIDNATFPWMPKLQEFVIYQGFFDIALCSQCPSLVKCKLYPDVVLLRNEELYLGTSAPNTHLRELSLSISKDYEVFSIISEKFHCLSRLNIFLGEDISLNAFIDLLSQTNLQELQLILIPGGINFDLALTGLGKEECETMEATQNYICPPNKPRWKTFEDWKCLRKLTIINMTVDYHAITGVATCQGFALIKSLTCLELVNFKIADVFVLELLDKMNHLTTLKLRNCMVTPIIWDNMRGLDDYFRLIFPHVHVYCDPPCPPICSFKNTTLEEIRAAIKEKQRQQESD